jgi:hypothetical protein
MNGTEVRRSDTLTSAALVFVSGTRTKLGTNFQTLSINGTLVYTAGSDVTAFIIGSNACAVGASVKSAGVCRITHHRLDLHHELNLIQIA